MDDSIGSSSTTLHIRKTPKKSKSKKNNKQIKVVYISNPMKVEISASNFMALVQKLTGQDAAELPEDPTLFTDANESVVVSAEDGGDQRVPDAAKNTTSAAAADHARVVLQQQCPAFTDDNINAQGVPFDIYDDDVFTPQMIENFTGLIPQSLLI
ncbi:hypothetical protein Godav_028605 [Gossypium davidsonii]|uniref:VQ domain-containing protein n=3 Tax=Gossypium TaxID=3633 RepID=A0A7J8RZY8_GOSDV|nr:hypothetical protein [Gossypium davidsonii]MBA0672443.1 hypothetical protein [Gossypium klotzschianum]